MRRTLALAVPWILLALMTLCPSHAGAQDAPDGSSAGLMTTDEPICEATPDAGISAAPIAPTAGIVAAAITVPDPSADPATFVQAIADAIASKHWMGAFALILVGVIWVVRKRTPLTRWVPFLATRWGGWLMTQAASIVGALAQAVLCGQRYTFGVFVTSVYVGFLAAGGWELVRDLRGAPPVRARARTRRPR